MEGEFLYNADAPTTKVEALYPEYTREFSYGPGTYDPDSRDPNWELTDISLIGLLVGLGCTLIFLIFAIVNIIIDETKRHADFEADVLRAKETLRESYGCDDKEMAEIDEEFDHREKVGDQKDEKAERAELAEIN